VNYFMRRGLICGGRGDERAVGGNEGRRILFEWRVAS